MLMKAANEQIRLRRPTENDAYADAQTRPSYPPAEDGKSVRRRKESDPMGRRAPHRGTGAEQLIDFINV